MLLKKNLVILSLLLSSTIAWSQKEGYEIKVTLKPLKGQYIFLSHYSGNQFPLIDSALLDANSNAVFKGDKVLGGGIYLLVYPGKDRYDEFLIDKQQHFSIITDTASREKRKFINSPDNERFLAYQQHMSQEGKKMADAKAQLATTRTKADSARIQEEFSKLNTEVSQYRRDLIKKNPENILGLLLRLMDEPVVPPAAQQPGGRYDSLYAYRYFKDHYWDNIYFFDDRITRTPASLFEARLDKYFNTLVYPAPDSVIKEIDNMLGYASVSKEMTRILLVKFVNRYLNQKYMWEDAVFVHLFEKYFSKNDYDWLTEQGKKTITDRAFSLMANIMGNPAENISLPDSTGVVQNLYDINAPYTVVAFWDPTCGHCKEVLPRLDSLYQTKWKAQGVKLYAVGKETDGSRKNWLDFIHEKKLGGWTHVYYTKEEERKRTSANIPGYTQLYDAQTVPAIYLLDKDKRIIAKKMSWQQTDEILQLKLKNP